MKIIFFGTPVYVLPILETLNRTFRSKDGSTAIVAVVTQPPKPTGRQRFLKYSPVDDWAYKRKVPIFFDFSHPLPPADLGILASYGKIIPQNIINHFPHGILVVHPSLLPKYRGSSPVTTAMIDDANPTGVTIFRMDEKIDHGPIVSQFKEDIQPIDTGERLRDRLFLLSVPVLIDLIPPYVQGKINPKPQDDTKATYTNITMKEDGFVDLDKDSPCQIERKLRAFTPWPGIFTNIQIKGQEKRLKFLKLHLEGQKLVLDEVQLEGKNPVSWKQFCEAYKTTKL